MSVDWKAILRQEARELSREDIDSLSDREAQNYYYGVVAKDRPRKAVDNRKSICFTGFTVQEREPLAAQAESSGYRVVDTVNKNLYLLVCGLSPGPSKIQKAREQDTRIVDESEFRKLLTS